VRTAVFDGSFTAIPNLQYNSVASSVFNPVLVRSCSVPFVVRCHALGSQPMSCVLVPKGLLHIGVALASDH